MHDNELTQTIKNERAVYAKNHIVKQETVVTESEKIGRLMRNPTAPEIDETHEKIMEKVNQISKILGEYHQQCTGENYDSERMTQYRHEIQIL